MANAYHLALVLHTMSGDGVDGTVSSRNEVLPNKGYYVGGKFPSLVVESKDKVDRGELAWWIGNNPAKWYGVWTDTETGKIYFDGVTHMVTRSAALWLARGRSEIAIWDIAEGAEIRLAGDNA